MKRYKKIPSVGSVMTPFPYFVDADAPLADVERLMAVHNIRHIPVQQDGRVVGIISERDVDKLFQPLPPGFSTTIWADRLPMQRAIERQQRAATRP